MQTVRELLAHRPRQVVTTSRHTSVYAALALMAQHDIGALPVLDGSKLVGILSERDYARGVALRGRSSRDMEVAELMVAPVVVTPDDGLGTCMERMTERRVRHLPVLENGVLIGIVTIGDLVKATMDEQALLIHELEGYIRGS
jgi:CBS domain-containing protein